MRSAQGTTPGKLAGTRGRLELDPQPRDDLEVVSAWSPIVPRHESTTPDTPVAAFAALGIAMREGRYDAAGRHRRRLLAQGIIVNPRASAREDFDQSAAVEALRHLVEAHRVGSRRDVRDCQGRLAKLGWTVSFRFRPEPTASRGEQFPGFKGGVR